LKTNHLATLLRVTFIRTGNRGSFVAQFFWDRFYDFLNSFAKAIGGKWRLWLKTLLNYEKLILNIGLEKPNVCRKLEKIAEIGDITLAPNLIFLATYI
jgi:hypothetical protein